MGAPYIYDISHLRVNETQYRIFYPAIRTRCLHNKQQEYKTHIYLCVSVY